MASCYYSMAFLSLMLVAGAVVADRNHTHHDRYIAPALAPYVDSICDSVDCGNGTCKVDLSAPFNFKCECEAGWMKTRFLNENHFQFLPCIIPNCSLDYSCMPASTPAPAPAAATPYNTSIFDPCFGVYCGEGTCKSNKPYGHTCECQSGSYNILNISFYPCYSDCAIGSDCASLGVLKSSNSTSSTSTPPSAGTRATSFLSGNYLCMIIVTVSIFTVLWK